MSETRSENITLKQVATSELSAAARLDRATEDRLYALYRAYFLRGEEERRWVVWTDVAWDETGSSSADPALADAVWSSYCSDALLPDYSARAIQILRSSRARAWFLTRWAYEKAKHLLGLNEWFQRSGAFGQEEVREATETLLSDFQWEPETLDGISIFAEFLGWELQAVARYRALRAQADTAGDRALVSLLSRIVTDVEGHRDFFAESLRIIAETYPVQVAAAVQSAAKSCEDPAVAVALEKLVEAGNPSAA